MEANAFCGCGENVTRCVEETERAGELWARSVAGASACGCVVLSGPLGAGKTAWVRGFARGMGCTEAVASPTFALVHEYDGGAVPVFHLDFYRLRDEEEVWALGWTEMLQCGWVVVEWGERFPEVLPRDAWRVVIQPIGGGPEESTRRLLMGRFFESEMAGAERICAARPDGQAAEPRAAARAAAAEKDVPR